MVMTRYPLIRMLPKQLVQPDLVTFQPILDITESLSVADLMGNCRSMLHWINLQERDNIKTRTDIIMRSMREVRKPTLEQQQLEWDQGRDERLLEGFTSLLKMVSGHLVEKALSTSLGVSPSLMNAATKAWNKKKKPLT
jgi:hypothetical protein